MPSSAYSRSEHLRSLWPWLPLWTAVALLAIFSHGPMPLYSTRTLAVAWEMWNHGHWLVPHINGEPYSEKVPLLFWLIHAGWFVFGVNDVWPRILEVIFGGTELVLLATLARRLFPNRPWVAKGAPWMLLALAYAFLFGLQIMYEVLLAVWVLAALLCLTPKTDREEPRWLLFGLCIGAGLMTKGPVMFLHIAFPWLLGPLWSSWANTHRVRWYGRGVLAMLLGGAILLAWALPAGFSGGEAYRQRLFFTQTAGRVVDAFDHARPFWWYLPMIPALLFPFSGWPRAWVALGALRRPLEPGIRFGLCWLLPILVAFSLISGKQLYYPLPEFAGAALLLAGAIAVLREKRPALANSAWLGTWPLGVGGLLFAVFLFVLPNLVAHNVMHGEFIDATSQYSRFFSIVFVVLGALLLLRGRGELRRLAIAGLVGTLALNTLFTLTMWQNFDLRPAAQLLGAADAEGRAIGYVGNYEGQFHFEGRITRPIERLNEGESIQAFARAHPNGLIITRPEKLDAADLRYPLLVQPFRSSWVVIWPAASLAAQRAGHTPPEPPHPTRIYQVDAWRYRALQ
ncbi:glycosyltransferase family 39 protein [Dyella sp. BiH032]|uniref:ArnT family glycosyltransferase n=1 Tax=Dyella sp. BiH032 TaxID=3075430 RepID=UPI002892B198|nr:glycosyltransferase family 39 protein [Dyella sp. BiH032]WNL46489.1 glycosyltransferase family 39 protein [Dyella sp. BiH032]